MLLQDVRLSIRLSHAGILSKQLNMSSNFLVFFSPSGSHTNDTILVFPYQVVYGNVSTGTAASGAKIFIFGQYLAFGSMTDGASNVVNSFEHGKLYHSKC